MRLYAFVLETLASRKVDDLNFQFKSSRVYPSGYKVDIAGCIRNGSIRLSSDPSRISSTPHLITADGSFTADTPPGHVHILFINPRWTKVYPIDSHERHVRSTQEETEQLWVKGVPGELHVRPGLSTREEASLRGTIIHEATHALQDWQGASLSPSIAEGAGYLAGAITMRLWGYQSFGQITSPPTDVHGCALLLADWFLSTPRHERYIIPMVKVREMKRLVSTGSRHRYVFNGI